jgi:hypothetical protein
MSRSPLSFLPNCKPVVGAVCRDDLSLGETRWSMIDSGTRFAIPLACSDRLPFIVWQTRTTCLTGENQMRFRWTPHWGFLLVAVGFLLLAVFEFVTSTAILYKRRHAAVLVSFFQQPFEYWSLTLFHLFMGLGFAAIACVDCNFTKHRAWFFVGLLLSIIVSSYLASKLLASMIT